MILNLLRKNILSFASLGALMCFMPVSSQALTLTETFIEVLQKSPVVRIAKQRVVIKEEKKKQAFAGFLPSLTATGSYNYQRTDFTGTANSAVTHPRAVGVTLSQAVFSGGSVVAGYKEASHNFVSQCESYRNSVQSILLQAAQSYVDVLSVQEVLTQKEGTVKVLSKRHQATKVRFEQGDVTRTDVEQAAARYASAKAGMLAAERDLTVAWQSLRKLLGYMPPSDILVWPISIPLGLPEEITKDHLHEVLESHPSIMASLHSLTASRYGEKEAKAGFLPAVTANAVYSYTENSIGTVSDVKQVGVAVSVPLFKGGVTLSGVREAKSERMSAMESYENVRREVEEELVNAWQSHKVAKAQEDAYKTAVEAAKLASYGVSREAELGDRTVLDVLDAEQELLDSKVDYTQARASVITTAYRLLAAMGKLTPEAVSPVAQ